MITPAFNLTATERVLPRLALDFTTASLDSRITFTRASNTATRVNSLGYIETINADLPRFDYDPVALTCKGVLIEESRSNIALQSNGFSITATWPVSRVGMAATGSSGTSPDGTNNAYKLNEDTGSLTKIISQAITATNVVNTFSVYVKAAGRTNIELAIIGSANYGAAYDLTAVTVGTNVAGFTQATGATIVDAGNGWRRCTITQNAAAGTSLTCRIYLSTGAAVNYTGNGTSGVLLYGAQLEAGAFATSYIPTVASQVTRSADVATMTGTNFSDWYNATEGAFLAQADGLTKSKFCGLICASDTTITNRIDLAFIGGTLGGLGRFTVSNSVNQVDSGNNATPTVILNTAYSVAATYKVDSFAWSFAANTVGTDTVGTIPTVTQLEIGARAADNFLNGHVKKISYWPQRLTNAEIQAFSKG
jgi:hypothetical protein